MLNGHGFAAAGGRIPLAVSPQRMSGQRGRRFPYTIICLRTIRDEVAYLQKHSTGKSKAEFEVDETLKRAIVHSGRSLARR